MPKCFNYHLKSVYNVMTRSQNVHNDTAELHPSTNVPTKYEQPTPDGFRDTAWTRFFPLPKQLPMQQDTMGEDNTT